MKTTIAGFIIVITLFLFNMNNLFAQSENIKTDKINVAILVYEGVYLMDFTGPQEVFYDSYSENKDHLFKVYTISEAKEIKAHCGLKISPDYDINNCPKPDILVIPGGELSLLKGNDKLKSWIIKTSGEAKTVISVCTGAFILADAGLLENQIVTTWHGAIEELQKIVPSAKAEKGVRYTDNGKIITTAGISAGIDGSLYVVSKYFGKEIASATAKYMDYEYWK
jgi:transcriptional regulator GlxA family with amidase domain